MNSKTHLRRSLRFESLEQRIVLASSAGAIDLNATWFMDTGQGLEAEIDLSYGLPGDTFVSGRWTNSVAGDHPGAVRLLGDGLLHWFLDTDGDPTHEIDRAFGLAGDIPIVGDWNGDGVDDVGVVRNVGGFNTFFLDTDGDPDAELEILFGLATDIPVIVDIDGDGAFNAGAVRAEGDGFLHWYFDLNGDPTAELTFIFGLAGDIPVVGDWNGDGTGNVGAVRQEGPFTRWYLDTNLDPTAEDNYIFGLAGHTPIAGDWIFPEVRVDLQGGGQLFNGGTIDFGLVQPGTNPVTDLVVANTGTATLNLGALSVPAGFEIVDNLVGSLQAGASDTIQVRFIAETAGVFSGSLLFGSNDGNENPFSLSVSATRAAPELEVQIDGIIVTSGQATPIDFGVFGAGTPFPSKVLTISNIGNAVLPIDAFSVTSDFEIIGTIPTSLAGGQSVDLAIRMKTDSIGHKQGTLRINSAVLGDYDLDQDVDGTDFLKWQSNFGAAATPPGSGADGDRDGTVNGADLGVWSDNFGLGDVTDGPSSFVVPLSGAVSILSGRPSQLGVVRSGTWLLDTDKDPDVEVELQFGLPGDTNVSGRWSSSTVGDHPGVVRLFNDGLLHWLLDTDSDLGHEIYRAFGLAGDIPIVGDWNGDGVDDVGVVRNVGGFNTFFLDTDGDPDAELEILFGLATDIPVIVDIDGDGTLNAGAVRAEGDGFLHWYFDLNGDPAAELTFIFGLAGDIPVVGDWNGDGTGNVGAVRQEGAFTRWYLDTDLDPDSEEDYLFGLAGDVPVVGDWIFPEVRVDLQGGAELLDGGEIDFGTHPVGQNPTKTFTITNTGNETLTFGQVSVGAGFVIMTQPLVSSLQEGENTDFVVQYHASSLGVTTSVVSFATNDGNENPFDFSIQGRRPEPEIAVNRAGTNVADGITTIDLGIIGQGQGVAPTIFTVQNIGDAALSLGTLSLAGPGFTILSDNVSGQTILPGGAALTFTIQADTSVLGSAVGTVTFGNNDVDEDPFDFFITANIVPFVPEIQVFEGSLLGPEIEDEQPAAIAFGEVGQGQSQILTFVISNEGIAPLQLQQPIVSPGFNLASGFSSLTIQSNSQGSFSIEVDSSNLGPVNGTVTFVNNDTDENPFDFDLAATIVPFVSEIRVFRDSPTGTEIEDNQPAVVDFGTVGQGEIFATTFVVVNEGIAPLTLQQPVVSNDFDLQSGFSLLTVQPGAQQSFVVELSAIDIGTATGTVTFVNNDVDENPFNFGLTAIVTAPTSEIDIPDAPNNSVVDLGEVLAGTDLFRTFEIFNQGAAELLLNSVSIDAPFSLVPSGSFPAVVPGFESRTFRVQLDTSLHGIKTGNISFTTNDLTDGEQFYSFGLTALVQREIVSRYVMSFSTFKTLVDSDGVVLSNVTPSDLIELDIFNDGSHTFTMVLDGSAVGIFGDIQGVVDTPTGYLFSTGTDEIFSFNRQSGSAVLFRDYNISVGFDAVTFNHGVLTFSPNATASLPNYRVFEPPILVTDNDMIQRSIRADGEFGWSVFGTRPSPVRFLTRSLQSTFSGFGLSNIDALEIPAYNLAFVNDLDLSLADADDLTVQLRSGDSVASNVETSLSASAPIQAGLVDAAIAFAASEMRNVSLDEPQILEEEIYNGFDIAYEDTSLLANSSSSSDAIDDISFSRFAGRNNNKGALSENAIIDRVFDKMFS